MATVGPSPADLQIRYDDPAYPAKWQEPIAVGDELRQATRALKVGSGGSLVVRDPYGHQASYTVLDGEQLPISIREVLPGTTATGIVGWW